MMEIENANAKVHDIVKACVFNTSCMLCQEWRDLLFMHGE